MTSELDPDTILDVVLDRFHAAGYGALSMRSVARDLGVTAPALYRHFANKQDLFAGAVEKGLEGLWVRLSRAGSEPRERDRLRASMDAIMEFALDQPRVYEVLAYPAHEAEVREVVSRLHPHVRAMRRFLQDRVLESMEKGFLRRDDPELVTLALATAMHGLIMTYRSGHISMDEGAFRTLYRECTRRILRGFSADVPPDDGSGAS